MKKILICVGCIILMFIPTYIAVFNYSIEHKNPIKAVTGMTITDTDGNSYSFGEGSSNENDEIENSTIDFFLALKKNASSETNLPAPLVGTDSFAVTFSTYESQINEQYYFSKNPDECYYVDSSGAAYRIDKEHAQTFVQSKYAKCLYEAASAPVLLLFGKTVTPDTMSWNYMSYDGSYLSDNTDNNLPETEYTVTGNLALNFSSEPDYLSVVVTDSDGTEIFNGNAAELVNAGLKENTSYKITAEAKWYENIVREAYGNANYTFNIHVQATPIFYLGETTIQPGEFVVISAKNVPDASNITFTSSPDINFTPVFFADGEYVRALVPISIDLSDSSSYEFTLSALGISQTLNLIIESKTFKSQSYDISAVMITQTRNATSLAEFDAAVKPYLEARENAKYFNGLFFEAVSGRSIRTGFGIHRTLINSGEEYRHLGVDYVVYGGDTVCAVNAGKVIYSGNLTLSGNTVIIDHGFGLKSLYAHMSSVSVSVGDAVSRGDTIGIVGSTGFTDGTGLHAGLYVFGTPVCPYSLWEDGVVFGD